MATRQSPAWFSWCAGGKYEKRPTDLKQGQIQFVRQGEATADTRVPRRKSVLYREPDGKPRVNLDRKLVFSQHRGNQLKTRKVCVPPVKDVGRNRADRVMGGKLWRGTWEEELKYADLMAGCKDKGWIIWLFPIEADCRGFPAQSVWKLLARLGRSGRLGEAEEMSSRWIWHRRTDLCWKPGSTGHHF